MDFVVAVVPVFLAAVVECVEAWTVVVAVGLTRGWRAPLLGVVGAVVVIGLLLAAFGATIVDRLDEHLFELVIGTLLLLFGLRWLRKAILRDAGHVALHDEDRIFRQRVEELRLAGDQTGFDQTGFDRTGFDWLGFATAGKAMLLEGLEITFLVVTLGSDGSSTYAVAVTGAALAFVSVGAVGLAVRRPLARVPENTLKRFVGIMLCTFGVYWVAEGYGVDWPGGAWAVVYLFGAWAVVARSIARSARRALDATNPVAA